jgi:PGF-CTERM protein
MTGDIHDTRRTLLLVAVMLVGAVALPFGATGVGAAQDTATIYVETPTSVDENETVTGGVRFDSVADSEGVGSYTINLTYNESAVSLDGTADPDSPFEVETAQPEPGVLRITGYISESTGPEPDGQLADIAITGVNATNQTTWVGIEVDRFTNADGESISVSGNGNSIAVAETSSGDDSEGGGGGGGLALPGQDAPPTETTENDSETGTDDTADEEPQDDTAAEESQDDTDSEQNSGGGSVNVDIPGFGLPTALVALISAALLAASRRQTH